MRVSGARAALEGERGFTLAEVLVTMTTMVIVLFALHSLFEATLRVFDLGSERLEAVESARLGLEKMQREVRAAYPYDPASGQDHLLWVPGDPATGAIPRQDRIGFGNDIDGNGKVDCPTAPASACELTTYGVYRPSGSSSYALGRARSRSGSLQAVVGNVADVDGDGRALTFEYLNAAAEPATTEPEVYVVRMTLEVEIEGRGQTLSTEVYLRNRRPGR